MNLSRITLAVKVFVAVVLFVNKSCLGSQGGQKIVEKRQNLSLWQDHCIVCIFGNGNLWELSKNGQRPALWQDGPPHNEVHWSPYTELEASNGSFSQILQNLQETIPRRGNHNRNFSQRSQGCLWVNYENLVPFSLEHLKPHTIRPWITWNWKY